MKKGNLVFSAICIVLAVVVIGTALGYPTAEDYGTGVPGPGLWPIVISTVMLACVAIMIYRAVKMKPENDTKIEFWNSGTKRVYLTMAILAIYLLILEPVGFIISTTVMQFIFIQWFAKKKPVITLAIAVVITMVVYLVFKFTLNVPIDSFGIFVI
ncbi:MAG: tripartite tricarboxylate transporter TctB family protein [Oscillospiraceae bacterium]|nr:tripartite tricarboxylate transporter TctB family protein [Oscillospiraceae bacterium]